MRSFGLMNVGSGGGLVLIGYGVEVVIGRCFVVLWEC